MTAREAVTDAFPVLIAFLALGFGILGGRLKPETRAKVEKFARLYGYPVCIVIIIVLAIPAIMSRSWGTLGLLGAAGFFICLDIVLRARRARMISASDGEPKDVAR